MGSRSGGGGPPLIGRRQSDFKRSFNLAVRSLLTTCPKQEFSRAFPNFTSPQQERLHQIFIQVIASLHGNIEDEFESLCLEETQVGTALDTVEQLVEKQCLDPLFSDKTNVMDAVHNLSTAKKAEIQYLRGLLERAEEQNHLILARVELLRNKTREVSGTTDVVEKLRGGILSYGEHKNVWLLISCDWGATCIFHCTDKLHGWVNYTQHICTEMLNLQFLFACMC